jgi:hypothetical protein
MILFGPGETQLFTESHWRDLTVFLELPGGGVFCEEGFA